MTKIGIYKNFGKQLYISKKNTDQVLEAHIE